MERRHQSITQKGKTIFDPYGRPWLLLVAFATSARITIAPAANDAAGTTSRFSLPVACSFLTLPHVTDGGCRVGFQFVNVVEGSPPPPPYGRPRQQQQQQHGLKHTNTSGKGSSCRGSRRVGPAAMHQIPAKFSNRYPQPLSRCNPVALGGGCVTQAKCTKGSTYPFA